MLASVRGGSRACFAAWLCMTAWLQATHFQPQLRDAYDEGFGTVLQWSSGGPYSAALALSSYAADDTLVANLYDPDVASFLLLYLNTTWSDDTPCQQFFEVIENIGINGAFYVVPMAHWHRLSQVAGFLISSLDYDWPIHVNVFTAMCQAAFSHGGTANVYGIMHGAVWYYIGTQDKISWDLVRGITPHLSDEQIMHALGHGVFIRQTRGPNYNACSPHPGIQVVDDISLLELGVAWCLTSPSARAGYICAQGLHHAWSEYARVLINYQGASLESWLYPCHLIRASTWCFGWLFNYGLFRVPPANQNVVNLTNPRYLQALSFKGHIAGICRAVDASDTNQLGCISGLSFIAYPYFFVLWPQRNSTRDRLMDICRRISYVGWLAPNLHCPLFLHQTFVRSFSGTESSLMEWCNSFVSPAEQQEMAVRQWKRWLACVSGSLSHLLSLEGREFNVSPHEIRRLCRPDLSWQAGKSWAIARSLCESEVAFGFSSELNSSWSEVFGGDGPRPSSQ